MRREQLPRVAVFAGLAAAGLWHLWRLQRPGPGLPLACLLVALALGLALAVRIGRRAALAGGTAWLVALAAIAGDRAPSRAHPLSPFDVACERVGDGLDRFASVLLPFDPAIEPGLHALLAVVAAVWLVALAGAWLVERRPLTTAVLGVLPFAIASSEFPLPRPGLRVALLAALVLVVLASGRRAGTLPAVALGVPLVLAGLAAASLPGVAHGALLDWRAWGTGGSGRDSSTPATDVRYAWDQSYSGLHFSGPPAVVLRIRSAKPSYWRVTVLDTFDGLRFGERSPAARPAAPGATARTEPAPEGVPTQVRVQVAALDEPYLIAPGAPQSYLVPAATGGGTLDANGVLRVLRPPAKGTSYLVTSVIAEPTPDQLRAASGSAPTEPPDPTDATPFTYGQTAPGFGAAGRGQAVARLLVARPAWRAAYAWGVRATAGARTPYDVASRLEQALRRAHPYDGDSRLPVADPDALARWIVSGDAGYCQMFSASMAELLRLLGVPARVAEGFDTGVYDPVGRDYVVDDRDAHAWVEAWLPGAGFVPFDPTPGHVLPDRASLVRTATETGPGGAKTTPVRTTRTATTTAPVQSVEAVHRGRDGWAVALAAGLAGAVLIAAGGALVAARRRTGAPGPRAQAAAARTRIADAARRAGADVPDGVTNGELAALVEQELGLGAGRWAELADVAAYAPEALAIDAAGLLAAETGRLADAIRARRRVTLPV